MLRVEESEATRVREAFRLCIQNHSLAAISATTGIHRDRVHDILHGRVYRGELQNRARDWVTAKHPPII